MALTQRLEFRQTQSLVMTPQLMQAIKLLQLSNLDLVAFVEEELERNPLLERGGDDGDAPERNEHSETSDGGDEGSFSDDAGSNAQEARDGGSDFDAGAEQWMDRDLGSRAEMEQTFDTGLENVFSEEPAEAASRAAQDAAPTSYTEWGGSASGDGDYNLESFVAAETSLPIIWPSSLRLRSPIRCSALSVSISSTSSTRQAICRPTSAMSPNCLVPRQPSSRTFWRFCRNSIRRESVRASLSECLAIQLRERDRYDPAMRALVENLDLPGAARYRFAAQDLRRR